MKIISLTLLFLSALASCAMAADSEKTRGAPFDVQDPKGVLTKDEWECAIKHAVSEAYRTFDTKCDGNFTFPHPTIPGETPEKRDARIKAEIDAAKLIANLEVEMAKTHPETDAGGIWVSQHYSFEHAAKEPPHQVSLKDADRFLSDTSLQPGKSPGSGEETPEDQINKADHVDYIAKMFQHLRLRADESQLADGLEFKAVKGAAVSFSSDLEKDANVVQIKGLLAYQLAPDLDAKKNDKAAISPYEKKWSRHLDQELSAFAAIYSDRTTNSSDKKKETDTLAFELIFANVVPLNTVTGDMIYWRGTAFYGSDWNLDATVPGFNLAAGAILPTLHQGIGEFKDIPLTGGNFQYVLQPELLAQYKHVFADGGNTALADSDDYARAGVSLGVTIRADATAPDWLSRLGLSLSYEHTFDFANDWDANDLFDSKLSYDLDKDGHAKATLSYIVGTTPLLEQDKKLLSFSLEFKL
ncbi:MAG TPA: hypothetical protein VHD56_16950 [Tepidisphaeraceae bacterium]|nr:hypothetical protein [Tepidisphaeraceae bacterium]